MKPKTILLIVSGLIVVAGAYWYYGGTGNESPLTVTTEQNESQSQFQTLVIELQPISFSTDIFSNPSFMALIDLATPVTPETAGRPDPFAPLTGASKK